MCRWSSTHRVACLWRQALYFAIKWVRPVEFQPYTYVTNCIIPSTQKCKVHVRSNMLHNVTPHTEHGQPFIRAHAHTMVTRLARSLSRNATLRSFRTPSVWRLLAVFSWNGTVCQRCQRCTVWQIETICLLWPTFCNRPNIINTLNMTNIINELQYEFK